MSTIDLSAGWVTPMIPRMFRTTDGQSSPSQSPAQCGLLNSGLYATVGSTAVMCLMKGAIPTTSAVGNRSADILCKFMAGSNAPGNFNTSQVSVNPAVISTEYVTASGSGTCTWFWWVICANTYDAPSGSYLPNFNSPVHQAYGSIGTSGSGADLEMPTVNIASGELYRIRNLRLQFPTSWNY